jgi:4-hydroxy-tetrahydrodipicolinate synthase
MAPREMCELTHTVLANNWESARKLHRKLLPLMKASFIESNPVPVKAALAMMGKMEEVYRLPLVPMQKENRAKLEKVIHELGLVKKQAAS